MSDPIGEACTAFTDIYENDLWGLARMEPIEDRLASYAAVIGKFIADSQASSIVEFGCGFWSYANLMDWRGLTYDGYDVVPLVVRDNSTKFAAPNIRFHVLTESTTPVTADVLVCKDVFQHLPNEDIVHLLPLLQRTAPQLLVINDVIPDDNTNGPIERGGYRAVRLDLPPFNETCATVHEWDSIDFGVACRKRAVLMRGG